MEYFYKQRSSSQVTLLSTQLSQSTRLRTQAPLRDLNASHFNKDERKASTVSSPTTYKDLKIFNQSLSTYGDPSAVMGLQA